MFKRSMSGERLRSLELFAECTPEELDRLDSLVAKVAVEAGRVLVREGEPGFEFLIVADGELAVTRAVHGSNEEIAVLRPGDFSGEIALLEGAPRSATVTALSPAVLYAANLREFWSLMEVPSVAAKIRSAADRRLRANRTGAAAA
jgi:CRP/FNR family transcriptional regulator, cyclic AMP receptor protein